MTISEVTSGRLASSMCQVHHLCSQLQRAFDSATSSLQKSAERAEKRAQLATKKFVTTNERSCQAQIIRIGSAFAQGLAPMFTDRSDLSQALYMGGEGLCTGVEKYYTAAQPDEQAKQQAADSAKRKISEAEQTLEQQRQRLTESMSRVIQQQQSATAPAA